jgi:endoribonuclease Dicer
MKDQVLSDMLEAIIGAIFVSDGFKAESVERFYINVMKPFFERYMDPEDLIVHPTRKLTDILDARGCHRFEITRGKNAPHSNKPDQSGQYFSEGN